MSNLASNRNAQIIQYLNEQQILLFFIQSLQIKDDKIIRVILEGFDNIFNTGERNINYTNQQAQNVYVQYFESLNGHQFLQPLLNSQNSDVSQFVQNLYENYFRHLQITKPSHENANFKIDEYQIQSGLQNIALSTQGFNFSTNAPQQQFQTNQQQQGLWNSNQGVGYPNNLEGFSSNQQENYQNPNEASKNFSF